MYDTLKKLQKEYPIGSIYKTSWNDIHEWCPTPADIYVFKQKHPNIRNFHLNDNGMVWCEEKTEYKVAGYLFNGESWYPAIETWDGWYPLDEEDINE